MPADIKATKFKSFIIRDGVILTHEIWSTEHGFLHRATMASAHGDWVGYPSIAWVNSAMGKFGCTMDNWQPTFPEAFEVKELKAHEVK